MTEDYGQRQENEQGTSGKGKTVEDLERDIAVMGATQAGAQATQAATLAGAQATQAAALAGQTATMAAGMAGMWAAMGAGFVALVVGLFLGLGIANTRR